MFFNPKESNEQLLFELTKRALDLEQQGSWSDVTVRLNLRILELDPEDVGACLRLARCRRIQSRYAEAKLLYQKVLEIEPTNFAAVSGLQHLKTLEVADEDLVATLDKFGIEHLHYMAPLENAESIFKHGILSYNKVKQLIHTSIADPFVQERRLQVHDYVPLYFAPDTPMRYVVTHASNKRPDALDQRDLVFFEVDAGRLFSSSYSVIFTDGNAAASKSRQYTDLADLSKLDWETIRAPNEYSVIGNLMYNSEWQRKKASEVLVRDCVPTSLLRRVIVYSDELVKRLTNQAIEIPIVVDRSHYCQNSRCHPAY